MKILPSVLTMACGRLRRHDLVNRPLHRASKAGQTHQRPVRGMPRRGPDGLADDDQSRDRARVIQIANLDHQLAVASRLSLVCGRSKGAETHSEHTATLSPAGLIASHRTGTPVVLVTNPSKLYSLPSRRKQRTLPSVAPVTRRPSCEPQR